MKITIKKSLQGLLLVPVLALGVSAVAPMVQPNAAYAQANFSEGLDGGINAATPEGSQDDLNISSVILQVVNVLLYIVGAIAVIMIIVGGFKYVTSGGDSAGVTSAKNTILYAVIGLVVALLAFALVNFVLNDLIRTIA